MEGEEFLQWQHVETGGWKVGEGRTLLGKMFGGQAVDMCCRALIQVSGNHSWTFREFPEFSDGRENGCNQR